MTFVRTYRNSPAVGTDSGEEKSPSTVGYRAYATKDTPSPQEQAHERWEFLNNKTDWATVSAIASEHTNIHDIPKLATFQSFSTQTFYEPSLLYHHHMLFYTHTFHCNRQGHIYSYLPFRPNNHLALRCFVLSADHHSLHIPHERDLSDSSNSRNRLELFRVRPGLGREAVLAAEGLSSILALYVCMVCLCMSERNYVMVCFVDRWSWKLRWLNSM